MGQERATAALSRIEQALARIESAARPRGGELQGEVSDDGEHRRAHLALRARVEGAIAQIDQLLESEEGR